MVIIYLVLQNIGRLPFGIGTHNTSLDYMELTCSLSIQI
jgi:hypothetical protein